MNFKTFQEFLKSDIAKSYRDENFHRMKEELRKICIEGNWPVASNEAALSAITNDNIDALLLDIYENQYKEK